VVTRAREGLDVRLGKIPVVTAEGRFVGSCQHVTDFGHHLRLPLRESKRLFIVICFELAISGPMFLAKLQLVGFPSVVESVPGLLREIKIKMIVVPITVGISGVNDIPFFLEQIHVTRCFGPLTACQGQFLPKTGREFVDVENRDSLRLAWVRVGFNGGESSGFDINNL
jgi:hypothetical protein